MRPTLQLLIAAFACCYATNLAAAPNVMVKKQSLATHECFLVPKQYRTPTAWIDNKIRDEEWLKLE